MGYTLCRVSRLWFAITWLAVCGATGATAVAQERLATLKVLQPLYPQAFFFRSAEGLAANRRIDYRQWEECFERLMGIEGKVLDEEVPGRSLRNIDFFTRFKERHPDQLVLLHFNGNARDPRWECERYFAGHFIYYNGAKILSDVPAEDGETEIVVDDPALFHTNVGRYRDRNDDVGLCELDEHGRPNWHASEQVRLVSVDLKRRTIRVRRGCYGTSPRAFRAGKAYAAAHVTEGPWGRNSHLLWYYNYSTTCPRDRQGRTCADILAEELAELFGPGGRLERFDGLEFDVLHHTPGGGRTRAPDCDADGKADGGMVDGKNVYGIGVVEFCRKLRKLMGSQRLILADGMSRQNQRAFGLLNGIESEGWPTLRDWEMRDWSGGMNRHLFWRENAAEPALSYINHKYITLGARPGQILRPRVPWNIHRLVFAAAVFTDSAICYSFTPPRSGNELVGIWDELDKGTENQVGWLGRPLAPAVRLATAAPDLLHGAGRKPGHSMLERFSGRHVRVSALGDALCVEPAGNREGAMEFTLAGIPCDGPDLLVQLTADTSPIEGYPAEIARRLSVGIAAGEGVLTRPELPVCGACLRGEEETAVDAAPGASVRWIEGRELAGQTHDCYLVHPPYGKQTGYTFWTRDVTVPEGGRLEFYTAMGEKSPQRSDGVVFRVELAPLNGKQPVEFQTVFTHHQVAARWVAHRVDLARWQGRRVRLKFISDCGPDDNAVTDHSHWGDVAVLGPEGRDGLTRAERFTTWVGRKPFTATFYFSEVHSKSIELQFRLEEPGRLVIRQLSVHAHPDVIYRCFEHGLVLANPSPRPFTFDLQQIAPGQRFRRLRGSAEQDPTTNNGQPTGRRVTLGPKDALFLVRVAR